MITNIQDFIPLRKNISDEGKKLVFTNGCFDIIHRGHISYLNKAKYLGEYLIIGLNSDNSVKRIKGENRPVNKEKDRAIVIDNIKAVDFVIIFEDDTPYNLISIIKPDILVKGGDWKEEDIVGGDIVKSYGGEVISLKYIDDYSTSNILKRISSDKFK